MVLIRLGNMTSEDLWVCALRELKATNGLSSDISRVDRRVVLEEVLSKVLERKKLCQQKRWKWMNRKGETTIGRDVFAKNGEMDKQIQGDRRHDCSVHAALPWAAVRFVLQVS